MIAYENYQISTNVKLVETFEQLKPTHHAALQTTATTQRDDRMFKTFFFCPNESCISTFESEEDLDTHIALDQHTTKEGSLRSKDRAKLILLEKTKDNQTSSMSFSSTLATTTTTTSIPRHYKVFQKDGWALRLRKPYRRIDENVKAYLKLIFEEEKIYGKQHQSISLFSSCHLLVRDKTLKVVKYRSKNMSNVYVMLEIQMELRNFIQINTSHINKYTRKITN